MANKKFYYVETCTLEENGKNYYDLYRCKKLTIEGAFLKLFEVERIDTKCSVKELIIPAHTVLRASIATEEKETNKKPAKAKTA